MEKRKPRQLYSKLFWTYTVIVLSIVSALTIYFITVSRRRILASNMEEMERISDACTSYIQNTERIANYIFDDLYRSQSELDDLLAYLELDPESYQQYCLDRYSATSELVYGGISTFLTDAFEAYEDLEKVELISYDDFHMTECYPEGIFYPGKDGKAALEKVNSRNTEQDGKLIYFKEVRKPDNMENVGSIIFTFNGNERFKKILETNEITQTVVLSEYERTVYQDIHSDNWEVLEQEEKYYQKKELAGHYTVYTFQSKKDATNIPRSSFWPIVSVGVLTALTAIICIEFYVRRLSKRVRSILDAMNQVTTGNLQVRLGVERSSDELDMIANNFNEMCEKMEQYIQKNYLAEIERKNAQMQALQSQINPHFLYNTLEAIRMKAIVNGDREVGKMLYSMVGLFRSQIKEADVITLGQELDYCKQYLELFQYRYQGIFNCVVECSPELLSVHIIKFILQPIVENYFIHGIDRERSDNMVRIWAERKEENLYLYIEDNGQGMTKEAIDRKNAELQKNIQEQDGKRSIGITNVNRRIKAVYGEEYGIYLEKAKIRGLRVTVTIKIE